MAYGGGTGSRVRGESPAVLGGGLAWPWAALQRLGGSFLGRGGMDSVVGPAAAVDEGLARSAARCLAAPEPAATDYASRPSSGATLQYCNRVVTALRLRGKGERKLNAANVAQV